MQFFKGDAVEQKFYNSYEPTGSAMGLQIDDFFNDAYACHVLGELIYDNKLAPLTNAIPRDIFRSSFNVIFDAFTNAGTFESYITTFMHIFGEDATIDFTIPSDGHLEIDITSTTIETSNFVMRYISENVYYFDQMITQDLDTLIFSTIKGFQSQEELEKMLVEMVPAGIHTTITLSIS